MSAQYTEKQRTMQWLHHELRTAYSETRDPALLREIVGALSTVDRDETLRGLFLTALGDADWNLASACIEAGFAIVPNEPFDSGPLHAVMSLLPGDRPRVIQWLLDQGAEINRRGASNATPLISACFRQHAKSVEVLIRAGADVNASTLIDDDTTPLMASATGGSSAIVELLLSSGADPMRRNRWDRDAADVAELSGHSDIANIIRDARTRKQ